MTLKDFKKLLVDLEITQLAIADEVGISLPAITKYFRGSLRNPQRRREIKQVLATRAREMSVELPDFWPDD